MREVDEVRAAADIVKIVGDYVKLRKSGVNFVGLCPFHQEKTPSFTVHSVKQVFHCFGCKAGGDVFNFVMLIERLTFPEALVGALAYSVCVYARDNHDLVDPDILAAISSLAETYRTLSSGIYYEKPLDYRLQRELYDRLRAAVEDHGKAEAQHTGLGAMRDADVRDALIFLAQLGFTRSNERPKGRAFLDLLRSQLKSPQLDKPASNIVLLP